MTQQQHKQYLIDGITEMQLFINKMERNINDNQTTFGQCTISAMRGIIDRKKANIEQYRELLRKEHGYVSPHVLENELYDFTY